MKYCLSCNVSQPYLEQADEIKFRYKDRKAIYDYLEWHKKDLVLMLDNPVEEIDWEDIKNLNKLAQGRLLIGCKNYREMMKCNAMCYRFYYAREVHTFQELQTIKKLGSECARLGAPIFFLQDEIAKAGLRIRLVPNTSNTEYLPMENGICGTWIRPEDIDLYEETGDIVEFENKSPSQEEALFRIYSKNKSWSGELSDIVEDLDAPCVNRLLDSSILKRRLYCGQSCMRNKGCDLCPRSFSLANEEKLRGYLERNKADERSETD